ncbi:MAG: hypothetical protein U0325_05465 [Polyangiales bacterium]
MKTRSLAAGMSLALIIAAVGYKVGRARADGVPSMNPLFYSGLLEDGGRPVEGARDITLRLWDAAGGGTIACPETTSMATPVLGGRFRIALDPACVAAIQRNRELWTEVVVGGTSLGRSKVGAVPYAIEAARAAGASGMLEARLATVESRSQSRQIVTASNGSQSPGCDPNSIITTAPRAEITPRTSGIYRFSLAGRNDTNCNCIGITGIAGNSSTVAAYYYVSSTNRPPVSIEGFFRLESGRTYVFGVGGGQCGSGVQGQFYGQIAIQQAE